MKKILLLGSGELGKELVISLQRLGCTIIACDSYVSAPAMQVADGYEVFDMLDANALQKAVDKHKPDLVVPEIEAIRTEKLQAFEDADIQVVPSAKAANYTMNRKLIRDLAAKELGLKTAKYAYATSLDSFKAAVAEVGMPCVVKPLMSSSGKGQSVLKTETEIETVWNYALEGSRGDLQEVIVEAFVNFHTEITLLTVTQKNGPTLFCEPIGHRQERGDYQESWQPCPISEADLKDAQNIGDKVTKALGGAGIWGIEFFIATDGVYFSELAPRPHDTGMVTLANTQNLSQFELHARTILGLPIPKIEQLKAGVSAVILASETREVKPIFTGIEKALSYTNSDIRVFRKPTTRPYRRMAVALVNDTLETDIPALIKIAKEVAACVKVN